MSLDVFNARANQNKLGNLFLGFFEGLFIDGRVHIKEIEALIKWVEHYPECVDLPHFETLYNLLLKAAEDPEFLLQKHKEISEIMVKFKRSDYFIKNTCDVQRLHGLMAGIVCDQTLNQDEVFALNQWLKDNDHLEEDPIYTEVYSKLKPVRVNKAVDEKTINVVLSTINRYVNYDNYGIPKVAVSSSQENQNPDFYHGAFAIQGFTICLTGASTRYTKAEWKNAIEAKNGIFKDDMTKSVDYLVICNKGNPHWAHMSYGRKFEQALKWQQDGVGIKILTEDDFVKILES
ncbi:BRCT domain-containing protein [Acinetobacter sp. ANC 4178]|uniref:BRCT domain-containing protein n=1 Tax=Acinetobacter sp. ANC 4178 TaxID=2529839 RepID=UPI0010397BCD|nr:BRCT domain-containing protein [Acinetobacter sp. ANC 4178]TCB68681.1 NAD-dependent DNA ligase [Acinetobacter sp. ANC 4178]